MMPRQEIESLTRYLDGSPRKQLPRRRSQGGLPSSSYPAAIRANFESKARPSFESQGLRLQRGTSGMGFDDDSDKENRLLSERGNGSGKLQRELDLARKRSCGLVGWRNVAVEGRKGGGALG